MEATWQRFERKALAKQEKVKTTLLRAESRGDEPRITHKMHEPLSPLATLSVDGSLQWNKELKSKIEELTRPKKSQAHRRPQGPSSGP